MPPLKDNKEHTDTFLQRVDFVVEMLLDHPQWQERKRGKELNELVRKEFNVVNRHASRYIGEGKKKFKELSNIEVGNKREKAIIDRERIILKAFKNKKLQIALNAMKDRDIIQGIYIEKTENRNINYELLSISDEELEKLINDLQLLANKG